MITIFTSPKPFLGHNKIIQQNAIRSWKSLSAPCEVILMGNDDGVAETAYNLGCTHAPNVPCSEYGTPLISGMFSVAEKLSSNRILCYANADIIFTNSLIESVKLVESKNKYLLVGQRYDLDISSTLNFDDPNWQELLKSEALSNGELHSVYGMDYFIFPKGTLKHIPDFVVGRAGWDNWMIYNARKCWIPLIDGTKTILAVHQNHDYSHCKGGKQAVYVDGPEVKMNLAHNVPMMATFDAIWDLNPGGIRLASKMFGRHFGRLPILYPWLKWPIVVGRYILDLTKIGTLCRVLYEKLCSR